MNLLIRGAVQLTPPHTVRPQRPASVSRTCAGVGRSRQPVERASASCSPAASPSQRRLLLLGGTLLPLTLFPSGAAQAAVGAPTKP
jgi:hypothetical protein